MKRCGLGGTLFLLSLQQCDSNDLNFAAQGFCRPPWIRLVSQSRLLQDMKRSQSQPNSKRTWNGIGHPAKACFVKESGNSRWHLRLDEKGCQLEEQRHHPTLFLERSGSRHTSGQLKLFSSTLKLTRNIQKSGNPGLLSQSQQAISMQKKDTAGLGSQCQYKGIIRAMNRQCWNFGAPKSHVVPCYPMLLSHVISCSFSHFVVQAKHVGYLNAERKGKAGARETFRRLSVCAWRWLWLRSCQSFLCCRKTVWTSQNQSCRQRFSIHSYDLVCTFRAFCLHHLMSQVSNLVRFRSSRY